MKRLLTGLTGSTSATTTTCKRAQRMALSKRVVQRVELCRARKIRSSRWYSTGGVGYATWRQAGLGMRRQWFIGATIQARCGGGALLGAELRLKDGVCKAECDLKNKVESVRTSKCSNVARTGATTLAQDSVRGERVRGRALWCSHWEGDERSAR